MSRALSPSELPAESVEVPIRADQSRIQPPLKSSGCQGPPNRASSEERHLAQSVASTDQKVESRDSTPISLTCGGNVGAVTV